MSIRGVKFNYSVGEPVLCFEPDPTKARVLYDAKILDTEVSYTTHGQRIPSYHIHFQGWNNSWDRVVPENFILSNTEDHRILMKQLSDATRRFHSNKSRNKHIDAILRKTFKGRSPLSEGNEDPNYISDVDDDGDDISEDDEDEVDGVKEEEIANGLQNGEHSEEDDQSTDGSENSVRSNKSEDRKKKLLSDFEIPEILKDELEKDFISVNRDDMLQFPQESKTPDADNTLIPSIIYFLFINHLGDEGSSTNKNIVSLPAEHNVISILESFVKTFCVNILCGTPGKHRYLHKEGYHIPFERNIPLCKELVDGLRICFDYTLPLVLLYDSEKQQLNKLRSSYKYKGDTKASVQSPTHLRGRGRLSKLHTSTSSLNGEPSPKLPKLSPKILKKEKLDFIDEELSPRRLTRQSIHERKDSGKLSENESADDNEKDIDRKSDSVSSSRRWRKGRKSSVNKEMVEIKEEELPPERPGPSTRRGDRPPPLLLPSAVSGDKAPESSNDSTDSLTAANKEDVISNVLSWQLLPPEEWQAFAPSLVYGAQHLLRLFVKIPDIILSMDIPESKVKALVSLLEHFLDYLTERRTELFTSSSYKCIDKL